MAQASPKGRSMPKGRIMNEAESVLKLTRRFQAPREAVFRAFTVAEELKAWWGPKGFTCPVAQLDVRPGGRYHIEMLSPDGNIFKLDGEFREVTSPSRLVYTWTWGEGDMAGLETLVTLEFRDLGADGTELSLTHQMLPGAEWVERHEHGWSGGFDRLAEVLAAA